jgi:hypothetical protein
MEITIIHLLILVFFLFLVQFIFSHKEKFENVKEKGENKDKECGQKSVDYGFLHYIFNSPKTPAR